MKLSIIEDIPSLLTEHFEAEGYQVEHYVKENTYDLILIDLRKFDIRGYQHYRHIRTTKVLQKVLLFSSCDDIQNLIQNIDLDDLDFVLNSSDFSEMESYVGFILNKSLKRRAYGNMIWDSEKQVFQIDNRLIEFEESEYTVFEYLLNHSGNVVSAATLLNHASKSNIVLFLDSIKVLISNIRAKLHENDGTCIIDTVRGQGYIVMQGGVEL